MGATEQLMVESWIWYSVGIVVILIRLWSRERRYGLQGLKGEDKAMIVATAFYTLFVATNIITAKEFNAGTDSTAGLDDLAVSDEKASYILGSKYVLVVEEAMINTLYTLKACMLVIFWRLSLGHRSQLVVKVLSCYVLVGWIANQLGFFLLTCQPFSGNWASPPPNDQCISWGHYAIVQGVFNISSDLALLIFPIPLFLRTSYPPKQKLYLCGIFSLGVFVIACAILNKININDTDWQFWNLREASTAIYVSNIPVLVPLIRSFIVAKSRLPTRDKQYDSTHIQGISVSAPRAIEDEDINSSTKELVSLTTEECGVVKDDIPLGPIKSTVPGPSDKAVVHS